jgi:hypothetical protein
VKITKETLKQIIKEELEGLSRDDAIASLKSLSNVFDEIAQANYAFQEEKPGGVDWGYHPGSLGRNIPDPTHGSTIWVTTAEDIEDEYYDELQHAIDMLEDKEGTNPIGPRAVKHAKEIKHPMADELEAAMTRAVKVALPYMKSHAGSGSGITENKMKITKKQLRKIIKEVSDEVSPSHRPSPNYRDDVVELVNSLWEARRTVENIKKRKSNKPDWYMSTAEGDEKALLAEVLSAIWVGSGYPPSEIFDLRTFRDE